MRHGSGWFLALSAYWFASSFKWLLVLLVLLPARVSELVPEEVRASRLGLLLALGAVMALVGPPVFGYLSDRAKARLPFLAVGAVLTVLGLLALAYAPSYGWLIAAYILLQLADDIATGPYSALIPDLVSEEQRGTASGWMGILQVTGQVLAGLVGFIIPNPVGLFWLAALLNLAAAGLTLAVVREPPRVPTQQDFWRGLIAPWRSPNFVWVYLTRFLAMFGQYSVQNYLQYYLDDVVRVFTVWGRVITGNVAQATSLLLLMISLGAAAAAIPAGRLSDRIGRKLLIYLSGSSLALTLVPILLFPNFSVFLVVALVFGLGYGTYLAVDWALVSDVLPNKESHGTDMGIWQTSIVIPQMLAGALGGGIDRLNAQDPGSGYTAVFIIAAASFLAGALLVRNIRGVK